jgi:hypothetical protein
VNDAVEALQAKVGADSSAVTSSLDYKVAQLEGQGAYTDYSGSITFINFTLGNGTIFTEYTQVGDLVHYVGVITLGSTSSVTGTVDIAIPVAADNGPGNQFIGGPGLAWDGVNTYTLVVQIVDTATKMRMRVQRISGTFLRWDSVTATQPFSWGTGDQLSWNVVYKAA